MQTHGAHVSLTVGVIIPDYNGFCEVTIIAQRTMYTTIVKYPLRARGRLHALLHNFSPNLLSEKNDELQTASFITMRYQGTGLKILEQAARELLAAMVMRLSGYDWDGETTWRFDFSVHGDLWVEVHDGDGDSNHRHVFLNFADRPGYTNRDGYLRQIKQLDIVESARATRRGGIEVMLAVAAAEDYVQSFADLAQHCHG